MSSESDPPQRPTQAEVLRIRRRYLRSKGLSPEIVSMISLLETNRWKGSRSGGSMPKDSHVSWASKIRLSELEGYVVAVFVRLHASGLKSLRERQTMPPTLLSAEIADVIVQPYAFAMGAILNGTVRTIKDVDDFMTRPGRSDDMLAWAHANEAKVIKARKRLADLEGDFRCVG